MQVVGVDDDEVVTDASYVVPSVEKVMFLNTHDVEEENNDPFSKPSDFAKGLSDVSSNRKRATTRMEKRLDGQGGTGSKQLDNQVITGYNAFDVVAPQYNMVNLGKLYKKNAIHQGAVDAKVANIVGLGYDFIESPTSKRKFEDVTDEDKLAKLRKKQSRLHDDLMDKLDGMNGEMEFAEILIAVWTDYETTGNGYLEIGRSDSTGEIGYIGHIPSHSIRVRRQRDGFVQIIANKAVFFRNFGKKDPNPITNDPNPNELIHLKNYDPASTFYGTPDIVAAAGAVAGYDSAEKFNLEYFDNKAVPRHVVTLKGATLSPNLAKNILEFFETGLKGKNHRTLFIPLPSGSKEHPVEFKIEAVEAGIQDSSFGKYSAAAKEEILIAHRTPITKVSLPAGVNLAAARDADKNFKETVTQPPQRILEKKLNKIVKEWTDMFLLKLNEMTLTDENTQSMIDERRIKTGQRTPNELRTRDGHPQHEDGDRLVDMNAAGDAAKQKSQDMANRERDSQRSAAATDKTGEGRSAKGEGRTNSVK